MPRTFSVAERLYQPGAYGPLQVDDFTNANTEALEWSMTVGPDWPTDRSVAVVKVTLTWSNGDGMFWIYNGGLTNRNGTPRTLIVNQAYAPRQSDGAGGSMKSVVASGTMGMEVYLPITSAVSVRAV